MSENMNQIDSTEQEEVFTQEELVGFEYEIHFLDRADKDKKNKIIYDILSLWGQKYICVAQEDDTEDPPRFKKHDLLFNKTALNKMKVIFANALKLGLDCADAANKEVQDLGAAHVDNMRKKNKKKPVEEMTTEERMKEAGLVVTTPKIVGVPKKDIIL